ncbi:pumilio protein 9, putative, partial [Leishmania donovani]
MSSSAERFHSRYFPAVTERRSIAMSRDVAPPLHRNAGRS